MQIESSQQRLVVLFGCAVVLMLLAGCWFYHSQELRLRHDAEAVLQAIAQLKVDEIAQWRNMRLADANVLRSDAHFAEEVARYLRTQRPEDAQPIVNRFRILRQYYHYADLQLVDAADRRFLRLGFGAKPGMPHPEVSNAIAQARRARRPLLTELHRDAEEPAPHLGVIVPLYLQQGREETYFASAVLRIDATQYLFPLIQSWPTPSRSAETLLVRRAGDAALFLNDLRHRQDVALKLRIPLTQTIVPAVMAVLGKTGVVQGRDYRGVEVVSVLLPIPNSSWFMVAKEDTAEIYAQWRFHAFFILALIFVLSALLCLGALTVWQNSRKAHFQALYASEAARRAGEARHGITLRSIGDAVIATDAAGLVELLNPVAEALTGWTNDDAHGRPLVEVFSIINEASRQPVESPVTRVLREGVVVGLANHTVLVAKDGTEHPIADSGAPIRDEQGTVIGVVLVFRDVSVEHRYERERENTIELLHLLNTQDAQHELIRNITGYLQQWTGCEAVGVRLRDGEDFPYFETRGFPASFVEAENFLCERDLAGQLARDAGGHPQIACMCGNVLCGRFDPAQSFFTARGSFWSNCTTALLANTTEADRQARTRNRCNGEGYESVALIPLRAGHDTLGLLQLNDHAPNRFTPDLITFLESAADQIAIALTQRRAQQALRESEELYHSLFSNLLNGFAYCRMLYRDGRPDDFIYLDVNQAFETQTGLKNVIGKKVSEVIPGIQKNDPEILATYGRVASTGIPTSFESYVVSLQMWFSISVYRPKPDHFVAVFDVISARKQHEAEIQRMSRLYAVLSQVNQAVVHAVDPIGFLQDACRAVVMGGGFKVGWIGRVEPSTHLVVPVASCGEAAEYTRGIEISTADCPEGHGPVGTAIRTDRPYVCDDFLADPHAAPWHEKARVYNLRGMAVFPIHLRHRVWGALAIYSEEIGCFGDKEVALLQEAATDISFALENLENEVQRHRIEADHDRLATAIAQAAEIVVITDPDGIIQYVNPAFEQVTGFTRAEAIGQNPRLLKSDLHDAEFYRQLWDTIAGGHTWEGRIVNKKKDGTIYTEVATISPVHDNAEQIVNYVAVKRDITHELNLEAQFLQAQKMEVVGRLAGGIAHDFNNILTGVLGFTGILLEATTNNTPLQEDLYEIQRLGERAADLTRQLLAFSRRQALVMESLNPNALVENTTKMLRRLLGENITLHTELAGDLGTVKADAGQLEQVILNLALNAHDAMPDGGQLMVETANVELSLEAPRQHLDVPPGAYVMLAMTDTGVGMDKNVIEHIFEPFFTTKSSGKGTGLGLATVYGIIKQHGGSIYVYSEPGAGTTFKIYLPRTDEAAASDPLPSVSLHAGTETILLVEDEASVRDITERLLRRMGYTVFTAANGEDAMRIFQDHSAHISLLLTDIVMPGINGRELYHRLSALQPELKVLYMSGYTENAIVHHGILDSGIILMPKPFTGEILARKVREALAYDQHEYAMLLPREGETPLEPHE